MQKSLMVVLLMHLLLYIAIGLNIFVFRQVIVFVYLSLIPGFVLLKVLKLNETSLVDAILLSVGLSVAFLLFIGLLISQLYPLIGISQPLTIVPLASTISFLTLILFFVSYRKNFSEKSTTNGNSFLGLRGIGLRLAILALPVFLGVIGALFLNQPILLFFIIVTTSIIVLAVFSTKLFSHKSYPLVVFAISMALAFHVLLLSKYMMGSDVQLEYFVFRSTAINGNWSLFPVSVTPLYIVNYDSMLSITILPAIYSALLNVNGDILFKVLYPFVFSLVPVVLYRIYERQLGKSAALLSALFLISSPLAFYGIEALSLDRQIVAELFLVLSIFVLLDKKMSVVKRRLLLVIFGAALVVSHYSLAYIYLFFVISFYAISKIKRDSDRALNGTTVLLLFAMTFSWYTYSSAPLESAWQFFYQFLARFSTDIYSPAARSNLTLYSPILTFASAVNWVLFYIIHGLIIVGILGLLFKPEKTGIDPKYRVLSLLCAFVILLCIVIPNFASTLNFSRFYAITILFLAPYFVVGWATLVGVTANLLKRASSRHFLRIANTPIKTVVLTTLLVGYFLSQSGFINCVTEAAPLSLALDYKRMSTSSDLSLEISFYSRTIPEQDVFGAVWLSEHAQNLPTVYADLVSCYNVLTSYGLIPRLQMQILTNTTVLERGGLIYLGQLNIVKGIMIADSGPFNVSEVAPLLVENNQIYSNGDSEIQAVLAGLG